MRLLGKEAVVDDAACSLRFPVDGDDDKDDDSEVLDEFEAGKADADKADARGRAPRAPPADAVSRAAQLPSKTKESGNVG